MSYFSSNHFSTYHYASNHFNWLVLVGNLILKYVYLSVIITLNKKDSIFITLNSMYKNNIIFNLSKSIKIVKSSSIVQKLSNIIKLIVIKGKS